MSSTASFVVLNGLGLAVHNWVRETTQEKLHCAAIFGDDDFMAGSERACHLDQLGREACGLQTKEEATGRIKLYDADGNRRHVEQLALFTERLIDVNHCRIIPSMKPAGIYQLYMAYHNDEAFSFEDVFLNDMSDYRDQMSTFDSSLFELVAKNSCGIRPEHARRATAPRAILKQMCSSTLGLDDHIALGPDVKRLFDNLEAILLMFYPSTRGLPDRVCDPNSQLYGHPIIGLEEAQYLAKKLQGEDCYFKLKGRPLRFDQGPRAGEAAQLELIARGEDPFRYGGPKEILKMAGWGNPNKPRADKNIVNVTLEDIADCVDPEPIDYDDIYFDID